MLITATIPARLMLIPLGVWVKSYLSVLNGILSWEHMAELGLYTACL